MRKGAQWKKLVEYFMKLEGFLKDFRCNGIQIPIGRFGYLCYLSDYLCSGLLGQIDDRLDS